MERVFGIENIIFTIGGQGVSLIELLSVLSGLLCVFMATQRKVLNFWIGYLYNFLLFFLFLQKGLYSSMALQPISLAINMFGHYRWTHPHQGEKNKKEQLKITLLTNKHRLLLLAMIILFMVLWGTVISQFDSAKKPYLDAFVTGMILLAQYLSAQKKLDCWGAWLVVNVTNVILYILAGLAFMPMVSTAYLILAFFGFAMWRKEWKNEIV